MEEKLEEEKRLECGEMNRDQVDEEEVREGTVVVA